MAEHLHSGPAELGAPMDYAEHERTYSGFLAMSTISVLASISTLLALALFGFGGFWLGALQLVLMFVGVIIGLVTKGSARALVAVTILGIVMLGLSAG